MPQPPDIVLTRAEADDHVVAPFFPPEGGQRSQAFRTVWRGGSDMVRVRSRAAEAAPTKRPEQPALHGHTVAEDSKRFGVLPQLRELRLTHPNSEFASCLLDRQVREADDGNADVAGGRSQRFHDQVIGLAKLDHVSADGRSSLPGNARETVREEQSASVFADEWGVHLQHVLHALDLRAGPARIDDEWDAVRGQEVERRRFLRAGMLEQAPVNVANDNDLLARFNSGRTIPPGWPVH